MEEKDLIACTPMRTPAVHLCLRKVSMMTTTTTMHHTRCEPRPLSVSPRACTDNDKLGNMAVGSDVFIPSRSSLHCTGPHADGDYQEQDNVACVGSNPSEDVAISVGDLHGENTVFVQAHSRPRVTPSGCVFILNSIGLEILSAGFDQVSSPRKPLYALISLLLAIVGVVTCIWELIHGQMKEKGKDASSNSMVYRSLPDIFGLGLAVIQCVCSAEQYYFHHRQTGNPMRLSPVALYFYVCLVVLKYNWRV
ncbi:uncharacterized protein LOC125468447 isoform X8 [Pyrus x bretschneideri]|uniref:uncharacterized protein LOC125468447 isoform X8 n=1 Tax=Pyrus x bretschneideri TaxID=225117 RepID=UPI0020303E30|nr:uncharacterized protein LOC125468447 isoform X8 [Pyrus x bretschneideri]